MATPSTRLTVLASAFAVLCLYQSAAVLSSAGVLNAELLGPIPLPQAATLTIQDYRVQIVDRD